MATLEDLRELDEADFTDNVVIPLFQRMGFDGVKNVHGAREFGRDVVFYRTDPFGNKIWRGAQLKVVQVHGTMSQGGNYTEVQSQIQAALSNPYPDPISGHEVYMSAMYLITTQDFTSEAEEALLNEFETDPVYLIDGEDLMPKIREYEIPVTDEERFDETVRNAQDEIEFPREIPTGDGQTLEIREAEPMEEDD